MKFCYEYRTSDNVRHEGVVVARDRESAFALLKSRGIRPGRVSEAPGVLNKLLGRGKRWIAIGMLAVGVVVAVCFARNSEQRAESATAVFQGSMRRQVIGDAAVIELGIKSGWGEVFKNEGERFFASFAIPGVPAGLRNTTEREIKAALSRDVSVDELDGLEARQIKSIVSGMKDELRRFLAAGGSIVEYGQRLVERQERELSYFRVVKQELENAVKENMNDSELYEMWRDRNAKLRRMGIGPVPIPEGADFGVENFFNKNSIGP